MNNELTEAFKSALNKQMEMINNKDYSGLPEVKKKFHEILNYEPTQMQVLANLACCELIEGHNGLAINMIERVIERIPDYDGAWSNLAIAYRAEGKKKLALQAIKRAVTLNRTSRNLENLGTMYVNEGTPELGIPYLEEALKIEPNESACWNLGLLKLEQCDYYRGFHLYEAGLIARERYNKLYPDSEGNNIPFWRGEPMTPDGVKPLVVVYGEQGIGDELMYATAMEDILEVCDVIFDCHPRLKDIFEKAKWAGKLVGLYPDRKHDHRHHSWHLEHKIDFKLPIGSLFRWHRLNGIFPEAKYVDLADTVDLSKYPKPHVGIGWSGGTKVTHEPYRSVELTELFDEIRGRPGTYFSLQYQKDRTKSEIADAKNKGLIPSNFVELDCVYDREYLRTAELINSMDYCVLPNTSAVHLCGILGVKCYTFTPQQRAWRYCSPNEYMIMYPNVVRIVLQQDKKPLKDTLRNALNFGHFEFASNRPAEPLAG